MILIIIIIIIITIIIIIIIIIIIKVWPWSYGSWIYNYLCSRMGYHRWCCGFDSNTKRGVQHYV